MGERQGGSPTRARAAPSQTTPGCRPDARQASVLQPVPNDAIEGTKRILQTNLLAFLVRPAGIADRHLVHAPGGVPLPGNFRGDFRLEPEAIGAQVYSL